MDASNTADSAQSWVTPLVGRKRAWHDVTERAEEEEIIILPGDQDDDTHNDQEPTPTTTLTHDNIPSYAPPAVRLRDIVGHAAVKLRLDELLLPLALPPTVYGQVFTGLRAVTPSVLLFGPPGTGYVVIFTWRVGECVPWIVALLLSTFVLLTFLGSLYTLLLVQYDSFLRRTTFFYKYIHPHTAKPNSLVPWQAKPKPPGSQSDPRMS